MAEIDTRVRIPAAAKSTKRPRIRQAA